MSLSQGRFYLYHIGVFEDHKANDQRKSSDAYLSLKWNVLTVLLFRVVQYYQGQHLKEERRGIILVNREGQTEDDEEGLVKVCDEKFEFVPFGKRNVDFPHLHLAGQLCFQDHSRLSFEPVKFYLRSF